MNKKDVSEIKTILNTPKSIVIIAHKNPDGDAIGSSLGLYHYLVKKKHSVKVIMPNDYPKFLKWMPGQDHILKNEYDPEEVKKCINNAQIIFGLDFNTLDRIGNLKYLIEDAKAIKILIDHHQSPDDFSDYLYSDSKMSSTAEMIYHFIDALGDSDTINTDTATSLYVGIMTDTGSFQFSSTTSITHRVAANLIEKGAENSRIHQNVYNHNSYDRLQLLAQALKNLKLLAEYNTAYISLSQKELNRYHFKKGDTEGVVNYALSLDNIELAVIFIEHEKENIIKISFRSKTHFNVNRLARTYFEGGGHVNAAGGRSYRTLDQAITYFKSILPEYKNELKP